MEVIQSCLKVQVSVNLASSMAHFPPPGSRGASNVFYDLLSSVTHGWILVSPSQSFKQIK